MTFPSRVVSITEAQLKAQWHPTFDEAKEVERRWRRACFDFLCAVFNGAPPYRLRELADEIFVWRSKMLGQVPLGNPTGDRSPAVGTSKP